MIAERPSSRNNNFEENSFLQNGINLVKQAVEEDNKQNFAQALALYTHALEYLSRAYKYEKNPSVKLAVKSKIDGYLQRAEYLKENMPATSPQLTREEKLKQQEDEIIENIKRFMTITGCSQGDALKFLQDADNDMRKATDNWYRTDQMALQKFLEEELEKLVGLDKVKQNLRELLWKLLMDRERRKRNLSTISEGLDMVFLGNPGVGKTKIAMLLGKIYYILGITKTPTVHVFQRSDLVAGYIGHTAQKTSEKIAEAEGSIFFLDEAYRLTDTSNPNDFGREAAEEIMRYMNQNSYDCVSSFPTVFIFAGYKKQMEKFLSVNPGFVRRVGFTIEFSDYACEEIAEILLRKVKSTGFQVGHNVTPTKIARLIEQETTVELRSKSNGGLAERWLERAARAQSQRLDLSASDQDLITFSYSDFKTGLIKVV
eukprot:CAMPEP_0174252530 /NCGR_PEP_ID=MMETSP0439-20130205/1962_1 /TAXON_ID=0 /ORGANISM="Stereomyxa ramosa, Strain Chinc5" /LENGTH=428 /DNA_ID=CAMNT_0015333083 /DNA_START=21 /DNA_END=1303 /DNA_ORIENTATION=+